MRILKSKHVLALSLVALLASPGFNPNAMGQEPRFVPVTEGLLDTTTGLVWGHYMPKVDQFLTGGGSTSRTWSFTMEMWVGDLVDLDGDGTLEVSYRSTKYADFSNAFYGRSDTDWRIPTRDELSKAIQAGLMEELDMSPEPGIQTLEYYLILPPGEGGGIHPQVWSSTGKGGNAWVVDLFDGTSTQIFTSSTRPGSIPVRGISTGSGGGGGKGGKNK